MPTYDYVCGACKHEMEAFHAITAAPLKKCPQCGKSTLKRVIGRGSGVLFKGTGFYQTDYRSKNYSEGASKDKGTSDSPAKGKGDCGKGGCAK